MANVSNKFASLEDEGDADVTFKINEVVEGASQCSLSLIVKVEIGSWLGIS